MKFIKVLGGKKKGKQSLSDNKNPLAKEIPLQGNFSKAFWNNV